jgi:hypothetical protein
MARHLIVGDGNSAPVYSNGLLGDLDLDIQKLSSDGPTSLGVADTIADSDQIRFVQGGPVGIDVNVVSPWIYGRDIISVSKQPAAAQTAEVARIALATNATAAGQHTIKVINLTNGEEPFNFKSYTITVAAGATPTTQCTAFTTAINADLPYWVNSITNNGTSIDFTGFKKGEVKADGSVQEELVHMDFAFEAIDGNGNGTADTVTYQTAGDRGVGDQFYLAELEESLRGVGYGFYNRVELPNTPASSVGAGPYDMYHIVATKDGSSSSQIRGVDNLIEIYVALDPAAIATGAFEGPLNSYINSLGFSNV